MLGGAAERIAAAVECLSNPRAGEGFSTYSCPPAAMPRLLACHDALAANQQPGGMHFRMREAVGALQAGDNSAKKP